MAAYIEIESFPLAHTGAPSHLGVLIWGLGSEQSKIVPICI